MMAERFVKGLLVASVLSVALVAAAAQGAEPLYANDMEKEEVGEEPLDFLILDGMFVVKQEEGNRVLELPGAPLDTFGFLFGPTETDGLRVTARIRSEKKGRLNPAFGVGLNGVGGYRLQCSPSKRALEIYKGDLAVANIPFKWQSGKWLEFSFQISKVNNGVWRLDGKVWAEGESEPKAWQLSYVDKYSPDEEPQAGRSAIWATPYSSKPIYVDDLKVVPAAGK